MRIFCLVAVLLSSALYVHSQSPLPDGLKINGLSLDARFPDVVRKLGKPTRDVTSRKIDQCIGSLTRALFYPGLKVELVENARNDFSVFSFEITSAKWNVSGIKVGATSDDVQKLFGINTRTVEKERAETRWNYDMTDENPGGTSFYFRSGKLFKISTGYMMC